MPGHLSGTVVDEESRMRRLEKKEMERIANRFKVITPAEFERNLAKVKDNAGSSETQNEHAYGLNSTDGQEMDSNGVDAKQNTVAGGASTANLNGGTNGAHLLNSGKVNTKKRTHEEAFPS